MRALIIAALLLVAGCSCVDNGQYAWSAACRLESTENQ